MLKKCFDRKWINGLQMMEKDVLIFLLCIGFILIIVLIGVVLSIFWFKMLNKQRRLR